jgi:hypothetical protein
MQVTYRTILEKMEENLKQAKEADSAAKVREHIRAVKALCEVLLAEPSGVPARNQFTGREEKGNQAVLPGPASRRLPTDDGANGDFIFDF